MKYFWHKTEEDKEFYTLISIPNTNTVIKMKVWYDVRCEKINKPWVGLCTLVEGCEHKLWETVEYFKTLEEAKQGLVLTFKDKYKSFIQKLWENYQELEFKDE